MRSERRILLPLLTLAALILGLNYLVEFYPWEALAALLWAMFYLAALLLSGFTLLHWRSGAAERGPADWMAAGLMAVASYVYVLSWLKLVHPTTLVLFLLLPLAGLWRLVRNPELRRELQGPLAVFFRRHPLEYLPFLLPLAYSLLPIVFYDSLVYGVGTANFILRNGGFVPAPHFLFYNLSLYNELILVPSLVLGDLVPHICHFLLGVLFYLTVADVAAEHFKLRCRWLLVLILVTLPLHLFLLTTVKPDLMAAFFIFLAMRAYTKQSFAWSGLLFGFAIGIKLTSALAPLIFVPLLMLREHSLGLKKHVLMALLVLLMVSPLIIKNWVFTGNPLFPLIADHLPTAGWDSERYAMVRQEMGASIRSWSDLLRAPYDFSFKLQGAGGFVGPLFLIFLPFFLILRRQEDDFTWLGFAVLLLLLGGLQGAAFRYLNVVFVILALYTALVVERLPRMLPKLAFSLVVFLNLLYGWAMLEGVYGLRALFFQHQTYEAYLAQRYPALNLVRWLNAQAPRDARILVAGDARGYYLQRPYSIGTAHDYSVLQPYLLTDLSPTEFLARLRRDGYSFLLLDLSEYRRLRPYRQLTPVQEERLLRLVAHIRQSLGNGDILLYKL